MVSLNKYFLRFFLFCFGLTLVSGVLAALLPQNIAGIITSMPYLIAMILVLFKFIKQEQRAPNDQERKKLTLGYTLIFWIYNFIGIFIGVLFFSAQDPQIWQTFKMYMQNKNFMSLSLIMVLLIAIPLYLITLWFYGPQAKRMAKKMFPVSHGDESV